jgi:hypothetical protein
MSRIMNAHTSGGTRPLLTVLYIGAPASVDFERLRHEHIGVVAVGSTSRGLRLLKNFRVAVVICDVPDLPFVARLVATHTPVILLAGEDTEWGGPEVTVLSRRTPTLALAGMVRRLAAATGAADRNAA